jgi:hypothetical protein
MTANAIQRDERTVTVENAGYRYAYQLLSFGVLAAVAYRSFALRLQSWDLVGLVIISGAVHAGYQLIHRVVYRRWIVMAVVTFVVAIILAIVMSKAAVLGTAVSAAMDSAQAHR